MLVYQRVSQVYNFMTVFLTGAKRREWVGMKSETLTGAKPREWGLLGSLFSDYGSFPHSLLSTSKSIS